MAVIALLGRYVIIVDKWIIDSPSILRDYEERRGIYNPLTLNENEKGCFICEEDRATRAF